MQRRNLLRAAVVGTGSVAFGFTMTRPSFAAYPAQNGPSPYGSLQAADANGVLLPQGFTSRIVARSSQTVPGTSYTWHSAPDGGACFADGSGWVYTSNSEISPGGGASALRFDASGTVTAAYRTLSNTRQNCAGGATPWNSWLSCEEVDLGYVYETYPLTAAAAVQRPAMGRFKHEAAAADPDLQVVYLTEDVSDGAFYRFKPTTWGNLASGQLQVLTESGGVLTWKNVPDPDGSPTATRNQVANTKRFNGGEGCYYADGVCFFTTKGDNRVWAYDTAANSLQIAYDDSLTPNPPLTGVDNITGSTASGDLFVAEDGGNLEICIITPDDIVAPFLRLSGHGSSEITGPAFNPAGNRLYFSSQRGTSGSGSGGMTFEVTGPFRTL
ncbi:MAG TPA: alkaline phosphatase PhoX [Glycomyces sp.]